MQSDNGSEPATASEIDLLRARIAAAKVQKAEIEAADADRRELEALRQDAETAEQAARDEAAIVAAEKRRGDVLDRETLVGRRFQIAGLRLPTGVVIVRTPDPLKFRAFQDAEKTKTEDLISLVSGCVEHPDKGSFAALLDRQPGALVALADLCAYLAGARKSAVAGK
jgi:hypothetical protein